MATESDGVLRGATHKGTKNKGFCLSHLDAFGLMWIHLVVLRVFG